MAGSETTFGKYTLLRRIASGGMAEIYLARQEGMAGFAREVVIKRIHEHLDSDQEFVNMFLDEARLVAKLSHPNIVSVHEFGTEEDAHFLVMEYVDGEALSSAIKRSRGITPRHALRIVSEICAGLEYAHSLKDESGQSLGIVHRDVSPQNVLLGYDGSVKLIDFGIAKTSGQRHETKVGSFKGKYAYMAPEQARGKPADRRSDVHSVGIVLWEMLTGRSLFHRDSVFHSMEAVLQTKPPAVARKCPGLGPQIDVILAKALAKDPTERYQSCRELQQDVDELVSELGLHSSSLALSRYLRDLFKRESQPPPPPEMLVEPEIVIEQVMTRPDQPPALEKAPTRPDALPLDLSEELLEQELFELPREEAPLPQPTAPRPAPAALADEWESLSEARPRAGADEELPPDAGGPPWPSQGRGSAQPAPLILERPAPEEPRAARGRGSWPWMVLALIGFVALGGGLYVLSTDQGGGPTAPAAELDAAAPRDGGLSLAAAVNRPTPIDEPLQTTPAEDQDEPRAAPLTEAGLEEGGGDAAALPTAFLTIHSAPAGAQVWIDGRPTRERTSVRDLPLDPGEHLIELTFQDHQRFRSTVNVEPGQTLTVRATLIATGGDGEGGAAAADGGTEDYGLLSVETTPPSRVFIRRRDLGRTPLTDIELPAGVYPLTFAIDGGQRFERSISIRSGRSTRRSFDLLPAQSDRTNEAPPVDEGPREGGGGDDATEPP